MVSASVRGLWALVVLGAGTSLWAGPRIIPPGDREGAEVRETAAIFLKKMAEGDADGAKALFAGPETEGKLFDAYVRLGKAAVALDKAVVDRYGQDAADKMRELDLLRAGRNLMPRRFVVASGHDASIATFTMSGGLGGIDDLVGLDLHRTSGGWRVVSLSPRGLQRDWALQLAAKVTEIMDQTRSQVEAGKLETTDAAWNFACGLVSSAYGGALRPVPTTVPALRPSSQPAADAMVLQKLIGKELASQEIQDLMAPWQALPALLQNRYSLRVGSLEAGLVLVFQGRSCSLVGVSLIPKGEYGSPGYPGAMPLGLSPGMERREIENRLGPPAMSSGGDLGPYEATYPTLGLRLEYARASARDAENPLRALELMKPAPNGTNPSTKPADGPRLTFRLVVSEEADADRLADPDIPEATILVKREAVIDETGVARISRTVDQSGHLAIGLTLTKGGTRCLEDFGIANQGRRLAVVLDGHVITAPAIRGKVVESMILTGAPAEDAALIERLHAVVNALPATRPAK